MSGDAWLDKDRARLTFLSCDFVSSSSGYFHSTVMFCDGHRKLVAHCPTIRQAVDLVAEAVGGKDWVTRYTTEDWAVRQEDQCEDTFDGFAEPEPIPGLLYVYERIPDDDGVIRQGTEWTDLTDYPRKDTPDAE